MRGRSLLLCCAALLLGARIGAAATQCAPTADQVAFFADRDFQGKCAVREIGAYAKAIELGVGTAGVSALKVGANVQVLACDKSYYAGTCEVFVADDADLGDDKIGNDRIVSVKIQKRGTSIACEPRANEVAFFEEKDCKGACEVRGPGSYRDDKTMGIRNDQLTSVKVGSGAQVVLCAERDFGGNCERLIESRPNLGSNTRIGNDKTSSARVQAKGEEDCPPGPKQVALYAHNGFLAPCELEELGDHADLTTGTLPKASVSSIRIGKDVQAVLCRQAGFTGECERLDADDASLSDNRIGNDKASSLKVQPRGFEECVPQADEAALFENERFLAPCVVKKAGDYADAAAIGLADNAIASIRVGASLQVCACADPGFGGGCSVFTADAAQVGSSIGIISSVRVQARGAACGADPVSERGAGAP